MDFTQVVITTKPAKNYVNSQLQCDFIQGNLEHLVEHLILSLGEEDLDMP
eukprot:m.223133 g.223133  ORF g.223133 m.223133 type:complete len:50 (+) comp39980_c1_seq23:1577-1726(+)